MEVASGRTSSKITSRPELRDLAVNLDRHGTRDGSTGARVQWEWGIDDDDRRSHLEDDQGYGFDRL